MTESDDGSGVREYLLVLLSAAVVTWLATPVARLAAIRFGAMAAVRDRDVHSTPTPRWGGLAIYAGLFAGLSVAAHLPVLKQVGHSYAEPRAVLLAGGLICALGAIDDRWGIDALTKLAGQIVAAGVMVLSGVQLVSVTNPFTSTSIVLTPDVGVPLTVLLVVTLVNAVNFVDGLDGLAAGVVAISAAAMFLYSYQLSADLHYTRAQPATLVAAVCIGVCLGFLPHNFAPARLFMGDSGSMLIGLLLAAATVSVTGSFDYGSAADVGLANSLPLLVPLLVPLAVLAVPFMDLALAVVRRSRAGRSPFAPDKQHLHHRLLEIGHSTRRAVLLMYAWSALMAFAGVGLSTTKSPGFVLVAFLTGMLIVLTASALPRLRRLGRGAVGG